MLNYSQIVDIELGIQYPVAFVGLCLLAGLVYAAVLYTKQQVTSKTWQVALLFTFRILSVAAIAFMLLAPFAKWSKVAYEQPKLVFALDMSSSIIQDNDSAYAQRIKTSFEGLAQELSDQYEVETFAFSDKPQPYKGGQFQGVATDFSSLFKGVSDRFENRNLGALVLWSDGRFNQGSNPLFSRDLSSVPIYSVPLGSSQASLDIGIETVTANQIAYLGNTYPVKVSVRAQGMDAANCLIKLVKSGQELDAKSVVVEGVDFYAEYTFLVTADEPGLQKLDFIIESQVSEPNLENNTRSAFIEVLDGSTKILLLANAPHPDIAAIKNSVERNERYEFSAKLASEVKENDLEELLSKSDLLILHNLPAGYFPLSAYQKALEKTQIPVFFIVGPKTNLGKISDLRLGLTLKRKGVGVNAVQPISVKSFSAFDITASTLSTLEDYPPLSSPFLDIKSNAAVQTLLKQRIGRVETNEPLMAFSNANGRKSGFLVGEGIWRWFLNAYKEEEAFALPDELLNKGIQFLAAKEDRRRFRAGPLKNIYSQQEKVVFRAELYNQSMEPSQQGKVSLKVVNAEKEEYDYELLPTEKGFQANLGSLAPGEYNYSVTGALGSEKFNQNGELLVKPVLLEQTSKPADHGLLKDLAIKSGGQMVSVTELEKLKSLLSEQDNIKPVIHERAEVSPLIDAKWIFWALLFLLAAEWSIRKMLGTF